MQDHAKVPAGITVGPAKIRIFHTFALRAVKEQMPSGRDFSALNYGEFTSSSAEISELFLENPVFHQFLMLHCAFPHRFLFLYLSYHEQFSKGHPEDKVSE